ncbi:extracellular solute-binding protein [Gracilibacillus timonensis]|uniref:extracellular solute-binding protein n=1 Tax=Gracilibacillus timonensis TaxID=1816696 RepID=UPI00082653F6|nr:extracellular solute-binding protein [Gracilibacillus timonensis]
MKKMVSLSILFLSALFIGGCSSSGGSSSGEDIYIFNTKSEISDSLDQLALDYEEETGKTIKTFSPGSGADVTETMNVEMNSNAAPTIYATNSLVTWGPDDGDFMYNMQKSTNDELQQLADEVPDNLRLNVDNDTNFGIPYTLEGYGYIVDKKLLADLFPEADFEALFEDLRTVNYEEFIDFTDKVDAFIQNDETSTISLNGNEYSLADEKTELTSNLTGIFTEAGAEKWTYSDHMINVPMNTVFESYSDALYSEPDDFEQVKGALIKYMEVLEYNTSHAAGDEGPMTRGSEFINGTVGSYDNSLQLFSEHKGLFLKQGNWIYPELAKINEEMLPSLDIIPIKMPFEDDDIHLDNWTVEDYNQTIPTFVPNYWIINKKADEEQIEDAEDFIVWLYTSDRGLEFLRDQAGFILYNDMENVDSVNTLNAAVSSYLASGKTMTNPFNASPGNFLFSTGDILKENYMNTEEWDPATYPDFADQVIQDWVELKQDSQY